MNISSLFPRPLASLAPLLLLLLCLAMLPTAGPAQDTVTETPAAESQPAEIEADAADSAPAEDEPADAEPGDEAPAEDDSADREPTDGEPADAAQDDPAQEESEQDEPAESEPTEGDTPVVQSPEDGPPESATGEAAPTGEEEASTDATAEAADEAAAPTASGGISPWAMAALIVALFVVPAVIGSWLGKQLGMPDHGWKIAVAIGTVAAGLITIAFAMSREDGFKLGPDLGGGVTLIYDLKDPDLVRDDDDQPTDDDQQQVSERREDFSMDEMIAALKERVDPTGTKEVTIRTRGRSIEFIIPKAGEAELEYVKKKITDLGQLEFRILVDRTRSEFERIVEAAEALPHNQTEVRIAGEPVARWVPYDVDEFGDLDDQPDPDDTRANSIVKRMGVNAPEILVYLDPYDVTGEYLSGARKGVGPEGYEVIFTFNSQGANRFGKLTGDYTPNPRPYYLGIILDEQLRSAPSIRSRIDREGRISGRGMDEAEVDHVVGILDAGSLPAALNKVPVSEAQTGPEIGALTIRQSTRAIIASLSIVLVFILIYYQFAGLVACLALVTNLVLVVAAMVLLNAAFTLPGLAGLVLTVGMSVDANVLIFERIREELARGATLRMAIRNGFGRATTTIVDANVTTLITGVVLYVIGTDQIKGFAVTLILGIIMSMYTAIFCARILFDIAERRSWITKFGTLHLLTKANFQFMRMWPAATFLSLVVIGTGLFGVAARQTNLLNIDFTGGTSVTMVLKEENAMDIAEVREALLETELADKNLLVVGREQDSVAGTSYKIDCSVLDEMNEQGEPIVDAVEKVETIIGETFGDKLQMYQVTADELTAFGQDNDDENLSQGFETTLHFGAEGADEALSGITHDAMLQEVNTALEAVGKEGIRPVVTNPEYVDGSSNRFRDWTVQLANMDRSDAQAVIDHVVDSINGEPIFPLANKIGGRVAGDLQSQASFAILVSLMGIVGYVWIRFQKVSYGLAAVAALVHDVLVTLGIIALSAFVVTYVPSVASALQVDAFQISLPIVAAFLTIIGYSLNDTIVVFDRIREVRGKSPTLTADMINTSVNQTLSRTILTSLTTLIVVVILYFFGGDGIHAFAFALVVGVIAGTYSTVFIASPMLLWLSGVEQRWRA